MKLVRMVEAPSRKGRAIVNTMRWTRRRRVAFLTTVIVTMASGCARMERVPHVPGAEVAAIAQPWLDCPVEAISVRHPKSVSMEHYYLLEGCGRLNHVLEACNGSECGLRSMAEAIRQVASEGGYPYEDTRTSFSMPDTLYVAGCGELWTVVAEPQGWIVVERRDDFIGLSPTP